MGTIQRFVVLVMNRSRLFITNQQLIVPGVFVVFVVSWQLKSGDWLYAHSFSNICKVLVPYLLTAWVIWIGIVVYAARDLKRELENPQKKLHFNIVTASGDPVPREAPHFPMTIMGLSILFIAVGFALPGIAVYGAFLNVEPLPRFDTTPPPPPEMYPLPIVPTQVLIREKELLPVVVKIHIPPNDLGSVNTTFISML